MADTKGGINGFSAIFPNINIDDAGQDVVIGTVAYGPDQVAGTEICKYMFIKNGAAAAKVQWKPFTFDPTVANRAVGIQPTTASLPNFLGVVAGSSGITNGNFGWALINGPGKALVDGSGVAIVAGDFLKGQNASDNMLHDAAKGSAPAFPSTAIAVAATTSAGVNVAAIILSTVG